MVQQGSWLRRAVYGPGAGDGNEGGADPKPLPFPAAVQVPRSGYDHGRSRSVKLLCFVSIPASIMTQTDGACRQEVGAQCNSQR